MSKDDFDIATAQLDRVLGFFSRVESKASWLFAMDTGLLAIAALNFSPSDLALWYVSLPAVVFVLLAFSSMFCLYQCAFPHLEGGKASLIYFREIANRTEATFIDAYQKTSTEELARDVLGQVWRNSEILKIKFDKLKQAFILTALAVVAWTFYLLASSIVHAQGPLIS